MSFTVLDHLWADALTIPERALLSPIPKLLSKMTGAPVVALSSSLEANCLKAFAGYANEELLPGASLSDLLYEECDVEVPENAIIYIETAPVSELRDMNSACITNLIGQIVVKLATGSVTGTLIEASGSDDSMTHFSGGMPAFSRIGEVVQ